ncbi:MAG: PhoH family protein, partial [candidate division WOR-3 bacterium]
MKASISLIGYDLAYVVGIQDELLKYVQNEYGIIVVLRNDTIYLKGPNEKVRRARIFIQEILKSYPKPFNLEGVEKKVDTEGPETIITPKRTIKAKSSGQAAYIKAIDEYDIVVSIGPAGTGKTYLGVAKAVSYLMEKKVERIILTRPAVEAGESLGFLPGAIEEKVDPYLRPLFDALNDFLPYDRIRKYLDMKVIEVAPLAYMRGRTLNDSFIILDEAQNTTG